MPENNNYVQHLLVLNALLLILLSVANADNCQTGEKKVLVLWKDQSSSPAICSTPQRSRRGRGSIVLEMKHHFHTICSASQDHVSDDKLKEIIVSDDARASSLQSRIKNFTPLKYEESLSAQIPLTSGAKLQTLNYIVDIEIGAKKMSVIVDTGSDLTWIQCKPCVFCYNQQDPLYDPSASISYQNVLCNSSTCSSLQSATGSSDVCGLTTNCYYFLSYGDGSYSRGNLAKERVNIGGVNVDNFVFGCGRSNRGLFGGASGLMGLGRTQLSLVSQTVDTFYGVFSYCLPSKFYNSSGSLVLGNDTSVYRNSTPIAYTSMISEPQAAPFYYLNMTGMSVGGVPLQAPGFSNGRVLIDSGTVITRLVPSVYSAVKAEFLKQFLGFQQVPGFSILDMCFNLSSYEEVKIPTLKFTFEDEVDLNVDVSGILYFAKKDASQACLALASLSYEDDVMIIGNYQQKNLRVVYDTTGSKLGFAAETCGYD